MATKAQHRHFTHTANEHQRAVVDNLQRVAHRHGISRVFSDFVEMSAIALARLDRAQFDAREARYLQIVGQYDRDELELLVQAFSRLVMAFESNFHMKEHGQVEHVEFADTLGSIYMMLNLGNDRTGQFFTPYHVSLLMAKMNIASGKALVEQHGFVRLLEPAVGAGGMVIATAQTLAEEGFPYQRSMHATAVDIDARCVHMAFIQFALLHIPAIVIEGNSLTDEVRSTWYTPAHIMGGWSHKLRERESSREPGHNKLAPEVASIQKPMVEPVSMRAEQLVLF